MLPVNVSPGASHSRSELTISLRGQTYPLSCRELDLLPKPETGSQADPFRERILAMLSFPRRHPDEFLGNASIVRAFGSDMVLLETMAQQWRGFLRKLRRANLQVQWKGRVPRKQQEKTVSRAMELMGYEQEVMVDDNNVLSGDLIERPAVEVFDTLQVTLAKALNHFVRVMKTDLEQLSDLRIVGLLQWSGETTCHFHFYEHEVTATVDSRHTEELPLPVTKNGVTRMGRQFVEQLSGRHVHRVIRHEELLIEAQRIPASDSSLVLPARVQKLYDSCPTWLQPELEVVEGEKVREEWVELVRTEQNWVERCTRKRIQPHFDPALTLFGEFVLVGWDDKAQQHEIRDRIRRSRDSLEATAGAPQKALTSWQRWATVCSTVTVLVTTAATVAGLAAKYISVPMGVVTGILALQALKGLNWRSKPVSDEVRTALATTWIFLMPLVGSSVGMLLSGGVFGVTASLNYLMSTVFFGSIAWFLNSKYYVNGGVK